MNMEPASCHGLWRLWLTEIPARSISGEELTLLPSGEARWCVTHGHNEGSDSRLQWRFDDEGCLLFIARNTSILSRCVVEMSGDLMTLTPAHGFRSLFARVV
jgi:hypothetical protein